jgi:hypothetical protein
MSWQIYRVVFRLRSALHIGCGTVGNLQRTRPFITGRSLWGALTMRLTRDANQGRGPAADSRKYREVGQQVHELLAYTYFYPATSTGSSFSVAWPWLDERKFCQRFLRSYSSTALSYPQQTASEGMLHEIEFISCQTLDAGEPVYLLGYLFQKDGCNVQWQRACRRLQLGGERGYGWGDVELVEHAQQADAKLFEGKIKVDVLGERPRIFIPERGRLLAHTVARNASCEGIVEPFVGREWRSDSLQAGSSGEHIEFNGACFVPGSIASQPGPFQIGNLGIWEPVTT